MNDIPMVLAADIAAEASQWLDSLGPIAKYIGALLIFLIGKIIAKSIGKGIGKAAANSGLDDKLSKYLGNSSTTASGFIGTLVGLVLFLFVLIFALNFAGIQGVTQPLNDLLGGFLGVIPNLVGAGIIAYIAFILAKVVKELILNVLQAARADERLGMDAEKAPLANGAAGVAYGVVALGGLTTALGILGIDSITKPVADIFDSIMGALPNILIAAVILTIGVFVAKIVRQILTNLLEGIGADDLPAKMGLNVPTEGSRSLSAVVGLIAFISVIVLMSAAAIRELDIAILSDASENIFSGYFNILTAILIFGAGLMGAKFAYGALADKNLLLAKIAKITIIVITGVAALQRSGIAPEVTSAPYQALITALGLALGLGGAIAIGLGGKDYVARFLERKG